MAVGETVLQFYNCSIGLSHRGMCSQSLHDRRSQVLSAVWSSQALSKRQVKSVPHPKKVKNDFSHSPIVFEQRYTTQYYMNIDETLPAYS